ncbi:MAG: uncharacterized protein KVP18_003059, partial [Porospora cf. gigantea A]|uniref:uncharacterized protein n=2 Tax=Porospora cf. gigantea A TaxID=2853593 RepID=UPI0035597D68
SASLARQSFFSKIGVELGEHDLTLSQILNCLLRDSRKSSDGTPKPTPLALHVPFDPRIHFVLQSKYRVISSDTLIRPESLDDQLQAAAEEFVNDPFNVSLRVTELGASVLGTDPDRDALDRSPDSARSRHDYHCDLTVPKWFSVFEVDFGRDWMQILKTISPWFKREKQLVANRMLELGRNITVDLRQHQLEWSLLSAGVGKHSKYPFTEESRSDA